MKERPIGGRAVSERHRERLPEGSYPLVTTLRLQKSAYLDGIALGKLPDAPER